MRECFPNVESKLMDVETLFKYQSMWKLENNPFKGNCQSLLKDEQELFSNLKSNLFGQDVRLEQEHMPISEFKF
jgi:hypothetical protein